MMQSSSLLTTVADNACKTSALIRSVSITLASAKLVCLASHLEGGVQAHGLEGGAPSLTPICSCT